MTESPTVAASTLRVPDGELYYEVRGTGPLVVLVGAPMDARYFEQLADRLAPDHTVLTTDPRGVNRSPLDNRDTGSTPEQRADDLARLIRHVDAGANQFAAAALGSSGGAVTVLALAQAYPDLVHTVIAHEPPLNDLLDDRADLHAKTDDIIDTHLSGDVAGAWRKFLALANFTMPEHVVQHLLKRERDPQTAADEHFQHAHMLRPTTRWRPEFDTLRSVSTRVMVGIGERSGGQLCDRTSRALAAALGIEPTMFPGGHIGFADIPGSFNERLREVLNG